MYKKLAALQRLGNIRDSTVNPSTWCLIAIAICPETKAANAINKNLCAPKAVSFTELSAGHIKGTSKRPNQRKGKFAAEVSN